MKKLMIKDFILRLSNFFRVFGSSKNTKYFCIGRNKTGTTSLEKAFKDLGYIVGNQRVAEELYDKSFDEDQLPHIIDYCRSAQVFQDLPFSLFDYVEPLDRAFPKSKFILTVRDNSEQWYDSITKFHAKLFGLSGRVPTSEDLKKADYVSLGFIYRAVLAMGTTSDDPYNKEKLISHYEMHNAYVLEYFKNRPQDLLVINVAADDAYAKFLKFLGIRSNNTKFPWENKT